MPTQRRSPAHDTSPSACHLLLVTIPPHRHGMPTQRRSPAHDTPSSACHLLLVTIPRPSSWHADPTTYSRARHPPSACHLLLVTTPRPPSWHADPMTISCARHTVVGVPSSSGHDEFLAALHHRASWGVRLLMQPRCFVNVGLSSRYVMGYLRVRILSIIFSRITLYLINLSYWFFL